jgi:predicted acetyltransferase
MLRVVDVPAALRARGCRKEAGEQRFTVAVRDKTLPWNDGVWRVEASDGRVNAESHDGGAGLIADATVLAPILDGYLPVLEAARAGLLEVADPSALNAAAAVFAVERPPFCLDYF